MHVRREGEPAQEPLQDRRVLLRTIGFGAFAAAGLIMLRHPLAKPLMPKHINEQIQESLESFGNSIPEVRAATEQDGLSRSYGVRSAPKQCYWIDEIEAPFVPDVITYDGKRDENAWNFALSKDLAPAEKDDKGASGKSFIMRNDEYLNICVEDNSYRNRGLCLISLDTLGDGMSFPPSDEDDFIIGVIKNRDTPMQIYGHPNDKAVPYLKEVQAAVHDPKYSMYSWTSDKTDCRRYEIGIPLKALRFYQRSSKLQQIGISIGLVDSLDRILIYPSSTPECGIYGMVGLSFSEIPVPEMPGWAWGTSVILAMAAALGMTRKSASQQSRSCRKLCHRYLSED